MFFQFKSYIFLFFWLFIVFVINTCICAATINYNFSYSRWRGDGGGWWNWEPQQRFAANCRLHQPTNQRSTEAPLQPRCRFHPGAHRCFRKILLIKQQYARKLNVCNLQGVRLAKVVNKDHLRFLKTLDLCKEEDRRYLIL